MFVLLRRGSVSLSPQRSAGRGSGRGFLEIPPLPGPLLQLRLEERETQRSFFRSRIFSEQHSCLPVPGTCLSRMSVFETGDWKVAKTHRLETCATTRSEEHTSELQSRVD